VRHALAWWIEGMWVEGMWVEGMWVEGMWIEDVLTLWIACQIRALGCYKTNEANVCTSTKSKREPVELARLGEEPSG
jgi:hypothetical protein